MTKRFTIALVALAIFVLVVIGPVSAVKQSTGPNYYYNVSRNIGVGATVYLGEEHLDLWAPDGTVVGYWASAAVLSTTSPAKTVTLTSSNDYSVTFSDYGVASTSNWYDVACVAALAPGASADPCLAFKAADPTMDVTVWAPAIAADVTGKSVTKGTALQFGIVTNQYAALDATKRSPVFGTSTQDGYIDLKVKTESGAILSSLYTQTTAAATNAVSLTSINVSTQPYTWGQTGNMDANAGGAPGIVQWNWVTDATFNGQPAYAPGVYTVWAESLLNNMKSKYTDASGATYTGKTISAVKTVTIVSDTVKITVNKDSVVRSKPFSVTITGRPSAYYCLWIKGASSLDNALDDQPPMLTPFQAGVADGSTANGQLCGNYFPQNLGRSIISDTANAGTPLAQNNLRYGNISMTTAGTRTVEFTTNNYTKAQKYTIKVEQDFAGQIKNDQVDVKVEKGAVTVVAAGDQSYYLGEEVKFSGTNTESYTTYLFIIGPNLDANGAQLNAPRTAVQGDEANMERADVASDYTWS